MSLPREVNLDHVDGALRQPLVFAWGERIKQEWEGLFPPDRDYTLRTGTQEVVKGDTLVGIGVYCSVCTGLFWGLRAELLPDVADFSRVKVVLKRTSRWHQFVWGLSMAILVIVGLLFIGYSIANYPVSIGDIQLTPVGVGMVAIIAGGLVALAFQGMSYLLTDLILRMTVDQEGFREDKERAAAAMLASFEAEPEILAALTAAYHAVGGAKSKSGFHSSG